MTAALRLACEKPGVSQANPGRVALHRPGIRAGMGIQP